MRIRYLPILLLTLVAVFVSYTSAAAQTADPTVLPSDQVRYTWDLQAIYPDVEAWEKGFQEDILRRQGQQ